MRTKVSWRILPTALPSRLLDTRPSSGQPSPITPGMTGSPGPDPSAVPPHPLQLQGPQTPTPPPSIHLPVLRVELKELTPHPSSAPLRLLVLFSRRKGAWRGGGPSSPPPFPCGAVRDPELSWPGRLRLRKLFHKPAGPFPRARNSRGVSCPDSCLPLEPCSPSGPRGHALQNTLGINSHPDLTAPKNPLTPGSTSSHSRAGQPAGQPATNLPSPSPQATRQPQAGP